MKFDWTKHDKDSLISKILLLVGILIVSIIVYLWGGVLLVFLKTLVRVSKPLLYAIVVAYILWPMLRFFENKVFGQIKKISGKRRLLRIFSLLCTYTIFLLIIVLFFSIVIPQVTESLLSLGERLRGYMDNATTWFSDWSTDNPLLESIFQSEFFEELRAQVSALITQAVNWLTDNISTIVSSATSYAQSFATEAKNVVLGVVFGVYFLLFKENLFAQIRKLGKAVFRDKSYERITHYATVVDKTFGGFINGKLLDSVIIGLLCFILMKIFRMPYASLISMIIGITNVIPFFGPFIGAIPSAFFIFIADPKMTLWFILLIIVVQQLDGNVIGPRILGDFVGLSPLWIIVSITVMGGLFGIFGMFFGVPTFAVVYAIVKELTERKLDKIGLPTETEEYYGDTSYEEIVKPRRHALPFKNTLESTFAQILGKIKKE